MRERHADNPVVLTTRRGPRTLAVLLLALGATTLTPVLAYGSASAAVPASRAALPLPTPAPQESDAAAPAPTPTPEVLPERPTPATPEFPAWIDDLAGYEPQTGCVPVAQPGTLGLAELVKATYPQVKTVGTMRGCTQGGLSEHKEGRALDVMLDARSLEGRAVAAAFNGWLTADDAHGNTAAMARRLGVMYIIWNRQIWRAYNPEAGWQPYTGADPHTNHIHISLSWAGALKRSTWWSLDPMTTPGLHLLEGVWWDVDCAYGTPPRAKCTALVKTQRPVLDAARKRYELRTTWVRDRTTVIDTVSSRWDENPLTRSGEFTTAKGRQWRVTCSAEAPAARTCQTYILTSTLVPVASTGPASGAKARVTKYVREPLFKLNSEYRLQEASAQIAVVPTAPPEPKMTAKPRATGKRG